MILPARVHLSLKAHRRGAQGCLYVTSPHKVGRAVIAPRRVSLSDAQERGTLLNLKLNARSASPTRLIALTDNERDQLTCAVELSVCEQGLIVAEGGDVIDAWDISGGEHSLHTRLLKRATHVEAGDHATRHRGGDRPRQERARGLREVIDIERLTTHMTPRALVCGVFVKWAL